MSVGRDLGVYLRARTNLAREPHPEDPQISDLPGNRQDPCR